MRRIGPGSARRLASLPVALDARPLPAVHRCGGRGNGAPLGDLSAQTEGTVQSRPLRLCEKMVRPREIEPLTFGFVERWTHTCRVSFPATQCQETLVWVLTLSYRLRYLLAWDHGLPRAVLAVHARALLGFYRRQANRHGIRDGRTGTLTVVQRFGERSEPERALPHTGLRRCLPPGSAGRARVPSGHPAPRRRCGARAGHGHRRIHRASYPDVHRAVDAANDPGELPIVRLGHRIRRLTGDGCE